MPTCPECDEKIGKSAKFCPHCGTKQKKDDQTHYSVKKMTGMKKHIKYLERELRDAGIDFDEFDDEDE